MDSVLPDREEITDLIVRLEKAAKLTDTEIYYEGYPAALLQEAADALRHQQERHEE